MVYHIPNGWAAWFTEYIEKRKKPIDPNAEARKRAREKLKAVQQQKDQSKKKEGYISTILYDAFNKSNGTYNGLGFLENNPLNDIQSLTTQYWSDPNGSLNNFIVENFPNDELNYQTLVSITNESFDTAIANDRKNNINPEYLTRFTDEMNFVLESLGLEERVEFEEGSDIVKQYLETEGRLKNIVQTRVNWYAQRAENNEKYTLQLKRAILGANRLSKTIIEFYELS